MSKLKLYTSSEDLIEDLKPTRDKLLEYGNSWVVDVNYQARYLVDFDAVLNSKNLASQYDIFDRFSGMIDNKFANEEWTNKEKRNEKDLIKYQLLCAMELKAVMYPEVPNSKAAAEYLTKIKTGGRQEEYFKDFISKYKDECAKYAVGYEGYKEIEKIHNQINATFVRLDQQMPSPENKQLVAAIIKDNPKILDYAVGDVGKRTWPQFFSDVWEDVKKPIIKLVHFVMDAISTPKVVEQKLPDSPPPLPKTPAPLERPILNPTISIENSLTNTPPPIPNFPPPEAIIMPTYAPPPIPANAAPLVEVESDKENISPNLVSNKAARQKLKDIKFPKGTSLATGTKGIDKVRKRVMESDKSPLIIQ